MKESIVVTDNFVIKIPSPFKSAIIMLSPFKSATIVLRNYMSPFQERHN
jgi:hypothetical protein